MKRVMLLASSTAVAVILSGCVVMSVYPYYTAKDLMFSPALVGTWSEHGTNEDAKDYWRFEKVGEQEYFLTTADEKETNHFSAHLFRLKQQSFLDFCQTNRAEGQLPLHYLLKVTRIEPSFQYQIMDYDWLGKLLEKNPKAIRHLVVPDESGDTNKGGQLVLTADTKELQKFVLKYSRDTNAFSEVKEMKRW